MKNARQCLAVIAIVVLEVLVLHSAVGYRFGPNNSVIGFYARDVTLPLTLGAFLFLLNLRRETPFALSWRGGWVILNAVLFVSTIIFLAAPPSLRYCLSAEVTVSILFLLLAATLTTALFVRMSPADFLQATRRQKARLGYAVAGFASLVLYARLVDRFASLVGQTTGWSVSRLFLLFGSRVSFLVTPPCFLLRHANFYARFATGCSGSEGIFFFLFLYGLMRAFERDRSTGPTKEVPYVLLGVLYMFLLNVLRIAFLFSIGILLAQHHSRLEGVGFFSWATHSNIGWLLFFPAIPLFFHWRRRQMAHAQ